MNDAVDKKFVDHPAPNIGLMAIVIAAAVVFVIAIPEAIVCLKHCDRGYYV